MLVGAWALSIAAGLVGLQRHAAVAATPSRAAPRWPDGAETPRDPTRPTLLVFVHPGCPCTRATLRQLERLLAHHAGEAAVRVLLRDDGDGDPSRTTAGALASRLPGAVLARDPGGREARRFGAGTSGEVMLYARDGARAFRGGVTPGRGHEGDSEGGAALEAALGGATSREARVYGCDLEEPRTP